MLGGMTANWESTMARDWAPRLLRYFASRDGNQNRILCVLDFPGRGGIVPYDIFQFKENMRTFSGITR